MKHFNRLFLREWHLRLRWYTIGGVGIAIVLGLLNVGFDSIVGLLLLLGLAYPLRFLWEWRHSSYSAVEYITLPVSMSEKWFVRWHIMTLWMPVVFFLSGLVGEIIADVLYRGSISLSLTGDSLWSYLLFWWIVSGIFAVGGLYFRRYALIKTLSILLVFFFALYLISAVVIDWESAIPVHDGSGGVLPTFGEYALTFVALMVGFNSVSETTAANLLWIVASCWLWLITWFRFKEIEA